MGGGERARFGALVFGGQRHASPRARRRPRPRRPARSPPRPHRARARTPQVSATPPWDVARSAEALADPAQLGATLGTMAQALAGIAGPDPAAALERALETDALGTLQIQGWPARRCARARHGPGGARAPA
jgi:hypothetical protein